MAFMDKILLLKGKKVQLPTLDVGEPAFCTDTNELFVGGMTGNIQFAEKSHADALSESVETLTSDMTTATSELSEVSTKVINLTKDVISLHSGVEDLYGDLSTLRDDVTDIQDEVLGGVSGDRPTGTIKVGRCYLDTTLNKPIWWNGSVWIDSAGTQVN